MMAYRIIRALKQAWKDIDMTVEEGLHELDRICAMQLSVKGRRRLSADTRTLSDCQRTSKRAGYEAATHACEIKSRGRH